MSDMYKFAAQKKLRFPSKRGPLLVEDLFQLPLTTKVINADDLDTVAKAINKQLKEVSEESFVSDRTNDPKAKALQVALDIVKDVIATRKDAIKAVQAKAERDAKRNAILDALDKKKGQVLETSSMDELKKQLADLDVLDEE